MVEHDLAKVGVAGSNPVFRSHLKQKVYARVVKLVDTQDLKSCGHCGRAGSIPAPGTLLNDIITVSEYKIPDGFFLPMIDL